MTVQTSIVVIGGGYAGVLAANRLQPHPGAAVTLVNPRPQFVERIRLHQLAAGNHDAVADYHKLLHPAVTLVVDAAVRIDADATRVTLASGAELRYDYLVYAVGSTAAAPTVPGAAQHAYPLAEYEDSRRLRARLQALRPTDPIVVVGAGPAGVEAAAELAEAGRPVTLVGAELTPSLGAGARRQAGKRLGRLGVRIVEGAVSRVGATSVRLADGTEIPSAATVWTAGFATPGLAADSGLPTDELGRLLTDETLTSCGSDRIVGTGDAVAPSAAPLRMSCQAALPLAAQAADTVLARLSGRSPAPINQAYTGQCVSLGRRTGVVQLVYRDDSPRRLWIGGRSAAGIKESICRATLWMLGREARRPGSYPWLRGDARFRAERELAEAGAR